MDPFKYFTTEEAEGWKRFIAEAPDEHSERGRYEACSREQQRRAELALRRQPADLTVGIGAPTDEFGDGW